MDPYTQSDVHITSKHDGPGQCRECRTALFDEEEVKETVALGSIYWIQRRKGLWERRPEVALMTDVALLLEISLILAIEVMEVALAMVVLRMTKQGGGYGRTPGNGSGVGDAASNCNMIWVKL
eukprot:362040_1